MNYFKFIFAGIVAAAIFAAPSSTANALSSGACLDGNDLDSYSTTFTRYSTHGTGTITTKEGRPLCGDTKIVLQSFNVPETWDGKGFNNTAIPQTKYASTFFTFPAGLSNYKKTYTVNTPHQCKNTQLDFNLAPEYQYIKTLTGDVERNIDGELFPGKGECEKPQPEPKPQTITCKKILLVKNDENRNVQVAVTGTDEYTSISGYKVDFGDGTIVYKQNAEHTYDKYGKFIITAYVIGKVDGETTKATSDACTTTVEFVKAPVETPPVVPEQPKPEPEPEPAPAPKPEESGKDAVTPEVLPDTGVGSATAIFGIASALGASIHYIRNRFDR